jgi:hypothetical protein
VQANWIKLSVSDGPTLTETKAFRAAGNAGLETKSTIGSHTVRGTVALGQLELLETLGTGNVGETAKVPCQRPPHSKLSRLHAQWWRFSSLTLFAR